MAETKKKIKPGAMALHPEDLAILVNYEVGGHTSDVPQPCGLC